MLANTIRINGLRWIKPIERAKEEVVKLILLEQFIHVHPLQARNWVMCQDPGDLEEAVQVMENYTSVKKATHPASKEGLKEGATWRRSTTPSQRRKMEPHPTKMETCTMPRKGGAGPAAGGSAPKGDGRDTDRT